MSPSARQLPRTLASIGVSRLLRPVGQPNLPGKNGHLNLVPDESVAVRSRKLFNIDGKSEDDCIAQTRQQPK